MSPRVEAHAAVMRRKAERAKRKVRPNQAHIRVRKPQAPPPVRVYVPDVGVCGMSRGRCYAIPGPDIDPARAVFVEEYLSRHPVTERANFASAATRSGRNAPAGGLGAGERQRCSLRQM